MEGNKAEILKKLMEMKKEFARKQKKLEKSKRTALVKAHVRQKIKEHEDLEKQQTSYSAVNAKEIFSAAQAACAGNVACVTKSPAGVEHKDYGSVQSAKMSTEMCLAPSVPSFSHQSVSNFREGFSVNGALSDEHLPFSECQKYNKGKNSCEGFEVTNQTQSLQVLEFDENQQKQSTDLSDGSRETKTATSEAAEEECILSKRLYTRKEQREDKSPIKQSFTLKSQEPQSSQHNKKNDTQDTGAMSPGKVAPKVTSTYTNSMSSEKRESETRGSKKLSSWMDFDDFKEAVVTPLRPLHCASSRSEKVSVKQCDQDGWLSAVKHKSKSVPYKRKGKYAKLKGNPKSQTAKKTLHTEMSRNEMSKYKEAKNIEKVSKDDVPVPKAINTHVYKGITSPCQLDMNTDKLVNDQEIPNSNVRNKIVTEDVDTISMTVFGRKDDLTCCPKQNGKELGGTVTASNHVNGETKDFFQSNNVCSDSVTKQPGIPFVKENEATIKDEEKIQNKPQVIGSISSNESDEEIVKASQVSTGRRISGVIAGGRKGLITRTQSSSLSTLSLTPSSTLASDCQEQENVGKEETVTDSQFFNILGVSQNDEGSTYKNCADDVSQGSHLSQFVFSAQKLQSDKVSSSEAETVQGDDSCQQSVKYDSVIVMDSETSCVPEDCPESPVASRVTRKSTCGEQISQDDFSEYTELDAIPYSQFELTEDFLSEDPCQPSSQTNININQKFRIRKAGALVKRRSPRTYFHDKGSPRTVGSSHSKPDYDDIRKTFMTKQGFKSHPKRSLNQQRKAAAVMSVFQFLVDEAKKPDAGRDFKLPSSFEKLKRERLADLNMKPQNSPVHSDTYLENQASKEDSISIIKESEPSAVVSELDNREMVVQSHHGTNSEEDNQGLAGVAVQSYVTTICDTQMSEDFVTDGCTLTGTDEEIEEPIAQETTKPSSQAGECRQGKDNAEKVTAVNIIPDSELDVEESIIKSPLPAHEKDQKTLFKSADNITPVSHKRKIRHFSKLGRRLFHTSLGVGMGASKGGNKQSEAGHDFNEGAEVLYATATKGEIELSEPSDDFSERHRMSQNKDSSQGSVTKCLIISSKYIRAASPSATNVATANPSMSTPTYSKHQILTTVGETPNLFESSQNHLSEHEMVPKPKAVHDAHHLHTMSPQISSSQKPTKVCDRNPLRIVINGENSLHRTSALQSPETPVFGTPSPVSSSQASRGGFSFTSTPKTVDTCKADRVISRLDFASPLSRDKSPEDSLIVARSADVNDTTSVSGEMHLSLDNNSPSLVSKSASINAVENHHGDHSSVSNNLSQMLQSEESYVSPAQIPVSRRELSIGNSPLQEILGAKPDDFLFGDKSAMSVMSDGADNSSHGDVRELDGLSGTPLIKPWKKLSKTATTPVQVLEEKQDHSPLGSFLFTPNKRRSRSKSSSQVENKGCPSNNFKFSGCFQSCSQDAVVSLLNGEVKTDSGSKRYLVSVQATSLTIWTEDEVCGWTTELDWRLSRDVHVMKACLLPREDVIMVIASGWERKRYFVSTFVYDINTEDTFRFNISLVEEYKELRSPTNVDLYPHTASELQLGVTTETHHTVGTVLFSDTLKAVQASSTCGLHHGKLVNLVGIKGQATASVSLTGDQRITIWNMEIGIAIRKIKLESSLPCLTGLLAATAVKGLLLVESLWRIDSSEWGGVLAVNPVNGQVQVAKKYQVPNNTWRRVESAKKESSVVTVVSDRGSFGVWDSTKGTMLGYNKSNITTSACLMKSSRDLIVGEIHGCLHIYSAS